MSVTVSSDYGLVLLTVCTMVFQYMVTGFSVGKARKLYNVPYPDMGDGRYAAKLSDEEWAKFMCWQRSHQNYLEVLTPVIAVQLIGGINFPRFVAALGVICIIGRYFYASGYKKHGPSGRLFGVRMFMFPFMALFVTAVVSAVKVVGWL